MVLMPGARLEAKQYLTEWGGELFPPWLEATVHPLMTSVLLQDVDARLSHIQSVFPDLLAELGESSGCTFLYLS